MFLGTLGARLLGNLSSEKGMVRAGSGNKKGKVIVRAGYGKECDFECRLILGPTLKYKSIMRINQYLMVFILETICLKK